MDSFTPIEKKVNKLILLRKNLVATKGSKIPRYEKQTMQQVLNAGIVMRLESRDADEKMYARIRKSTNQLMYERISKREQQHSVKGKISKAFQGVII